jgi:glycosyltransferase involved in cell wall biosynthesis
VNSVRISVIIPCYNTGRYLAEAISSALAQTLPAHEIIVVDDGSTDDTRRVVESFRDSGVRYFYQENRGLSAARNAGVQLATGDFLAFLDADDLFMHDKLETQSRFLEANPEVGLVGAHFVRIDGEGRPLSAPSLKELSSGPVELEETLVSCPFASHATLLSRDWFERVDGFCEGLSAAEDWDFYCRLAIAGCRMHKQGRIVCSYRFAPGSMSLQSRKQTDAMLRVVDRSFSNTKLPKALRALESRARAETCLTGMARCYATRDHAAAALYLVEALGLLKSAGRFDPNDVSDRLQQMQLYLKIEDPPGFYREVLEHLPSSAPGLSQVRRALVILQLEAQVRAGLSGGRPRALIAAIWAYLSRSPGRCLGWLALYPVRKIVAAGRQQWRKRSRSHAH